MPRVARAKSRSTVRLRVIQSQPRRVWATAKAADTGHRPARGRHPRVCSGCGKPCRSIHDTDERWVDDLPILGADTRLLIHRVRVACPDCGPKLERLDWLEPYARITTRLAENVARLCRVLAIKHVADYFALDWKTVKAIDKAHLGRTLGPIDLDGVAKLAMDEFAIQKGHRYATVVIDPTCKRVLWVGRGRSRDDVRPFFQLLGPERCKRIEAVAMDMNAAYDLEVREHCKNAEVVYDLFHVVAKYGREVVDRVRVDEAIRYAGQAIDALTGLSFNRARWYEPSDGRFPAEDTYLGNSGSPLTLHKYAYADNNPIYSIDPSGNMGLVQLTVGLGISTLLVRSLGGIYSGIRYGATFWLLQGGVLLADSWPVLPS